MDYKRNFIEIPFGARDSETLGWEYTIPDDMEAKIENGKIIVRKKKSEDEKIRKALIHYFNHPENTSFEYWEAIPKAEVLAWLEKQKPVNTQQVKDKSWNSTISHNKELEEKMYIACESYHNKETPLSAVFYAGVNAQREFIEKQGEQKPINDTNEDIIETVKDTSILDIVESKFKVGDWIVNSIGKVNQVTSVDSYGDGYTLDDKTYMSGSWCDSYHLWTIQDAKDGDVVVNGSNIFIFHFINDTRLMGYCHTNTDDELFYDDIGKNECFCLIDAIVTPATKEQRNLLFQKMKEAGYEWDAEKKELKKPVPKFEIGDIMRTLQEAADGMTDGMPVVVSIDEEYYHCTNELIAIKDQDDYEYPPMNRRHNSAWSEEDEEMFDAIIADIQFTQKAHNHEINQVVFEREIDWLKSLKDRVQPNQWKPSDEQIAALDEVYKTHGANNACRRVILGLLNELKRLKEE